MDHALAPFEFRANIWLRFAPRFLARKDYSHPRQTVRKSVGRQAMPLPYRDNSRGVHHHCAYKTAGALRPFLEAALGDETLRDLAAFGKSGAKSAQSTEAKRDT